jgi:hypothetical protein
MKNNEITTINYNPDIIKNKQNTLGAWLRHYALCTGSSPDEVIEFFQFI